MIKLNGSRAYVYTRAHASIHARAPPFYDLLTASRSRWCSCGEGERPQSWLHQPCGDRKGSAQGRGLGPVGPTAQPWACDQSSKLGASSAGAARRGDRKRSARNELSLAVHLSRRKPAEASFPASSANFPRKFRGVAR